MPRQHLLAPSTLSHSMLLASWNGEVQCHSFLTIFRTRCSLDKHLLSKLFLEPERNLFCNIEVLVQTSTSNDKVATEFPFEFFILFDLIFKNSVPSSRGRL